MVFGIPSGHWPMYHAIHSRPGQIRHILVRDERNGAFAADGYARVTNKVGVCDGARGPGLIKVVSGFAEAFNSSIPVLALADDFPGDQVHLNERGCAAQGMDQLRTLEAVSKWTARVPSQAKLPEIVRLAFAKATGGRPGPVALTIPHDVFCQEWIPGSPASGGKSRNGAFPSWRVYPDPDDVERAVRLLSQAHRPLIVAGGGVNISQAHSELRAFAEAAGIPVATSVAGKGSIAEVSPLSAGVVGVQYGEESANALYREADVILLAGCKSSQQVTFAWTLPTAAQRVVHMDIDPTEIGKVFRTEVGLVADARAGFRSLTEAVRGFPQPDRSAWHRRTRELKEAWEAELAAEMSDAQSPVTPQAVMAELRKLIGPDDVVVTDASLSIGWVVSFLDAQVDGQKFLFPRGAAGLGFGLGAAIGARLARPKGNVVLLAGDGGFAYSIMELATLAKYGLSLVMVVLNNSCLGYNRLMERLRGETDFQSVSFPNVDFAQVACGFGCTGVRVEQREALSRALCHAFHVDGPVVVDVVSDGWQTPELSLRAEAKRVQREKAT